MTSNIEQIKSFADFMSEPGFDLLMSWVRAMEKDALECLRNRNSNYDDMKFNQGILKATEELKNGMDNILGQTQTQGVDYVV